MQLAAAATRGALTKHACTNTHSHASCAKSRTQQAWKLLRWQYERLVEVVRPDAAR